MNDKREAATSHNSTVYPVSRIDAEKLLLVIIMSFNELSHRVKVLEQQISSLKSEEKTKTPFGFR